MELTEAYQAVSQITPLTHTSVRARGICTLSILVAIYRPFRTLVNIYKIIYEVYLVADLQLSYQVGLLVGSFGKFVWSLKPELDIIIGVVPLTFTTTIQSSISSVTVTSVASQFVYAAGSISTRIRLYTLVNI